MMHTDITEGNFYDVYVIYLNIHPPVVTVGWTGHQPSIENIQTHTHDKMVDVYDLKSVLITMCLISDSISIFPT